MRHRVCKPDAMETVYEAVGGADGLLRLAGAWHARVMADEVVSHAFSHGYHPAHTERLAAYWAEALGGPPRYSEACGDETSVVRLHSGNGPHEEMDRRAVACFDEALADVGIAPTSVSDGCCTTTSRGQPRPRCRRTTAPPTTCRSVCASRSGRGTVSSTEPAPTTSADEPGDRVELSPVAVGLRVTVPGASGAGPARLVGDRASRWSGAARLLFVGQSTPGRAGSCDIQQGERARTGRGCSPSTK